MKFIGLIEKRLRREPCFAGQFSNTTEQGKIMDVTAGNGNSVLEVKGARVQLLKPSRKEAVLSLESHLTMMQLLQTSLDLRTIMETFFREL